VTYRKLLLEQRPSIAWKGEDAGIGKLGGLIYGGKDECGGKADNTLLAVPVMLQYKRVK
jgi:hypothetical protein